MTDSVDRGTPTKEELEKLRNLPLKRPKDRTELSDLPGWARVAIVYKELFDMPMKETLQQLGIDRSPKTLANYRKSPAGKRLREDTIKFKEDPVAMAEALLRSSALQITVDRLAFLEMAKNSGNFVEADKIAKDLQDRVPELAKKSGSAASSGGGMVIQVTLSGGEASLEPVMIESEHAAKIEEADFEVEDE